MINSWRKSSYSATKEDCVEVGVGPGVVGVRDTKDTRHDRPVIAVSRAAWAAFVRDAARGDVH